MCVEHQRIERRCCREAELALDTSPHVACSSASRFRGGSAGPCLCVISRSRASESLRSRGCRWGLGSAMLRSSAAWPVDERKQVPERLRCPRKHPTLPLRALYEEGSGEALRPAIRCSVESGEGQS